MFCSCDYWEDSLTWAFAGSDHFGGSVLTAAFGGCGSGVGCILFVGVVDAWLLLWGATWVASNSWSVHEVWDRHVGGELESMCRFHVVANESLFGLVEIPRVILMSPGAGVVAADAIVTCEGAAKLNARNMYVSAGGVDQPSFVVTPAIGLDLVWTLVWRRFANILPLVVVYFLGFERGWWGGEERS